MSYYVQVITTVAAVLLYTRCTAAANDYATFDSDNYCGSTVGPNAEVDRNCRLEGYQFGGECSRVKVQFSDMPDVLNVDIGVCWANNQRKIKCCISKSGTWNYYTMGEKKYCDRMPHPMPDDQFEADEAGAPSNFPSDREEIGSSGDEHQTP